MRPISEDALGAHRFGERILHRAAEEVRSMRTTGLFHWLCLTRCDLMSFRAGCVAAVVAVVVLAGCQSNSETSLDRETEPERTAPPTTQSAAEPTRVGTTGATGAPQAEPAKTAQSAEPPLATRQGSRGLEVDLMRVEVTGDLLTVDLRFRNPTATFASAVLPIAQVSVIDDATSRRYGVVKDQAGTFMAAPLTSGRSSNRIMARVPANSHAVVWFKFPAPPPTSETVSINIPDAAPFDGIRLQR